MATVLCDPATRSTCAARTAPGPGGLPVHSLMALLEKSGHAIPQRRAIPDNSGHLFTIAAQSALLGQAFGPLDVSPVRMFPVRIQVEWLQTLDYPVGPFAVHRFGTVAGTCYRCALTRAFRSMPGSATCSGAGLIPISISRLPKA